MPEVAFPGVPWLWLPLQDPTAPKPLGTDRSGRLKFPPGPALDQQMPRSPSHHPATGALGQALQLLQQGGECPWGEHPFSHSFQPGAGHRAAEHSRAAVQVWLVGTSNEKERPQLCAATAARESPKERSRSDQERRFFETPSLHWAFWFDVVSCLGGLQYLCGVWFAWCWPGCLYITLKGCFFLVLIKKRTELKFLLPLGTCSLNLVHYASESDCNFLLLSGLQEAECTADMCS